MPQCDHAAFRVANLDRSIEFYTRALPAKLVGRKQHEDRWRTEIATLQPAGQSGFVLVLLMPRRVRWLLALFHAFVPRQTRSSEHLGFRCDSLAELEACAEAAQAAGGRVRNPLTRAKREGTWLFEALDPDGNAVEWYCGQLHDGDDPAAEAEADSR